MSTNNVLSPASGEPIIVPSQDVVLGIYYMTREKVNAKGEGLVFADVEEVQRAYHSKNVELQARVKVRINDSELGTENQSKIFDTTVGRALLYNIVPNQLPFDLVNKTMDKKSISNLINDCYRKCGLKDTVIFADQLMYAGFAYSTHSGASIGVEDFVVPEDKQTLIQDAQSEVAEIESQYASGLVTQGEKYNKVVDAWAKCSEKVADEMMARIKAVEFDDTGRQKPMNSVYMMSHSGARGSPTQMRQLAGMRGLMAKPSGEIIETPIISNFKEGLTVLEYFNSTHGARKGLADTALKTANSGYLTRRLVDVAQDCIVNAVDCGTDRGLTMQPIVDAGQVVASLGQRILGRTALDDINHPVSGELIAKAGTLLDERDVDAIEKAGIQSVRIRSALTCDVKTGVCSVCYGRDLARGTPVNMGEAVGVIAAQSIGEPGTQLTMRTFHMGGTAQVVDSSFIEASYEGTVEIKNRNVVRNSEGNLVVMGRNMAVTIKDEGGKERASHRVTYGARLFVDDGDKVKRGQRIAEWDPYTRPIMTEVEGRVAFEDLIDGVSMQEATEETTGITKREVTDWRSTPRGTDLKPAIAIEGKDGKIAKLPRGGEARYLMSVSTVLSVEPGATVRPGDVLARIPMESAKTKDITGGLPRVAELFEARRPKDHAIIAEVSGTVRFGRDYKNKRRIVIEPFEEGVEPVEYLIPKGKPFHLQDGDTIEKGDYLLDGNPAPHDILAIKGVEALASYLVNEIQEVYRLQGVLINDKHIEVIVRQMLQKIEITEQGDSVYIPGDHVDAIEFDEINERLVEEGKQPAKGEPVLLGITKASLQTPSFISAASFQETTRVLTEAAVAGKIDTLQGLKENVIVGRLVPAGTGGAMNQIRRIATSRDDLILEERRRSTGAEEASPMISNMTETAGE